MIDDVGDIAAFYDEDPEREHLRLVQHQLEHDLTWRYLDEHLPPHGSVLEVGAGTGRYTRQLARRGYAVTAVDLSEELVAQGRTSIADEGLEGRVRFVVADARDLGAIPEEEFDAVLMMGPLYHLVEEADRTIALEQARERLRPGGLIFSSFLSRLGVMADLIRNVPHWVDDRAEVRSLLDHGRRPDDAPRGGFRGYFARVSEIVPLHDAVGFQAVTMAGIEPAIAADDDSFNGLRGEQRERWLDLLEEISTDPSIIGASRHLLYIGRKPS
jgi:SAM-dependent methyltransferase